jgi:hypothetical protein
MSEFINKKTGQKVNLQSLAKDIVKVGGGRTKAFEEGKKAKIIDIHEAVMGSHISKEEGKELNPKYKPDFKDVRTGKVQSGRYSETVRQRQQSKGAYHPSKRTGLKKGPKPKAGN